jgi:uncharacterized protein DUF4328
MQTYSDSQKMFVSGKALALWTVILLGAEALAKLTDIAVSAAQLALASNYPETAAAALGPENADVSEMPGGNFQVIVLLLDGTVSLFGLFVFIAAAVVFLFWQHRAYKNLPTLGVPRPDFSSGWVIGSWFVPFLNLFRPYEIVKYIHNKSDPDTVNVEVGHYDAGGNLTLKAWWGFWIATAIVGRFSDRIYRRAENLDDHVAAGWVGIFVSGLTLVAACLAIAVVRDITSRQEERHKRLMAASQQQFWSAGASPN